MSRSNRVDTLTLASEDAITLKNAGLNLEELAHALANQLRTHPFHIDAPTDALSTDEEAVLREAGAYGVNEPLDRAVIYRNLAVTGRAYAAMVKTSVTGREIAKALSVTSGRISQRVTDRTLFALDTPRGIVFPKFQLDTAGVPLPGLERVIPQLPAGVNPVAIERFFSTPNGDLIVEGIPVSPRDYLGAGYDPGAVIKILPDIVGRF